MSPNKKRPERQAFQNAFCGICKAIARERHLRFDLAVAAIVLLLSFACRLAPGEWLAVIGAIVLVIMAELLNTALEAAVDLATQEQQPLAAYAKDVAAGAVLVASIGAVVIGCIIFIPKLFGL